MSSDPVKLKIMNVSDQAIFRSNGETGVSVVDVCSSFSKGAETAAIDTSVSLPYQVSPGLTSSLNEEQSHFSNKGSSNNSESLQVLVIEKEFDHNTVMDIGVDEGISSQNKNHLISQGNLELELVPCQTHVNNFLDLDSLLDLAETGNNQTEEIFDHTSDKHYLDELLASASNPFLEDLPFEASQEDENKAVNVSHPSNPFGFDGTLCEPEGNNSTGADETSNQFSTKGDVIERVISSKNPFLDTSSFKLAMDDFKMAEKTSGNDVTIEGDVENKLATHVEEGKTTSDGNAEAASATSTFSSQRANEKMKVSQQCNDPPANESQLQHEPLESSFASMNPYPPLVSYSGQIPFSGSVSLRTESSAASNRSFAFPVLQTELKASPVRMAKADRKHNSWKHTLLCCNF